MKKTAIIFPGQGSQYIGMGLDFVNQDPEASALLDLAGEISGFPLRQLCFTGPLEDLTRVLYLQPTLTAINLICWQQLHKRLPGFAPSFLAGHSLGEYSALYGAGVVTLADTLALVTKRGELMEREGAMHPGGMRAVVGMSIEDVESLLSEFPGPGVAVVANHNTASQVVLSGDLQGLDRISEICAARGAKVVPLQVSVANHSPLVAGAVEDFTVFMEGIPFHQPTIPILFNVTGDTAEQPDAMKSIMARQIASKVRWLDIINRMVTEGVEVIVELGPKNILTGMMKKNLLKNYNVTCMQADTPETLDKVVAVLAA